MNALALPSRSLHAPGFAADEADHVRCQAHDIKNQIGVVAGYCDLLEATIGALPASAEGQRQRAIRMIVNMRTAALHGARIASDLMISRAPEATPRAAAGVDLNALVVEEVGAICQDLLRQNINVQIHPTPHLPAVCVDALWLTRTLINLAQNARDAILSRPGSADPGLIQFRTSAPPVKASIPLVLLTVSDNGPGIAADHLHQIWEPGWSTKDAAASGARGYGLASVRAFATGAGGWIDVESRPGQGTEFLLCLPAAAVPTS